MNIKRFLWKWNIANIKEKSDVKAANSLHFVHTKYTNTARTRPWTSATVLSPLIGPDTITNILLSPVFSGGLYYVQNFQVPLATSFQVFFRLWITSLCSEMQSRPLGHKSQRQGQELQGQGLGSEAICKCYDQTEGKIRQCWSKQAQYHVIWQH